MGDSSQHSNNKLEESAAVELTGKIMVVAIIVLFVVVVFVVFLHLYSKWYWRRLQLDGANPTRRRRRFDFTGEHNELAAVTALRHGLNPSVLKSIPVIEFCAQDLKEELECSVCLCEVCAGEKARVLPKCNHAFHVECIDMWFQSHSTCPLCRNPVSSPPPESISEEITMTRNPPATTDDGVDRVVNFPTNFLFWGDGTQIRTLASCLDDDDLPGEVSNPSPTSSRDGTSTSSMSHMVIDIPTQSNPDQEDEKSPAPTRLRSLKRLLSWDMRINPFSPATATATADVVDQ